jgi:hypothetical protein
MDHRLMAVFNTLCPVQVRFGRTDKGSASLAGCLTHCTIVSTKRKGGGFVFWIRYQGQVRSHKQTLTIMLADYCATLGGNSRPCKPIKNQVVNASKDLLFVLDGYDPIPLGTVFPCAVRDMKSQRRCYQWISQVSRFGFGVWCPGFNAEFAPSISINTTNLSISTTSMSIDATNTACNHHHPRTLSNLLPNSSPFYTNGLHPSGHQFNSHPMTYPNGDYQNDWNSQSVQFIIDGQTCSVLVDRSQFEFYTNQLRNSRSTVR